MSDSWAGARQCKEKPKGDKYGFTHFARHLNDGKGIAPLPSDSRRRPDRFALEVMALKGPCRGCCRALWGCCAGDRTAAPWAWCAGGALAWLLRRVALGLAWMQLTGCVCVLRRSRLEVTQQTGLLWVLCRVPLGTGRSRLAGSARPCPRAGSLQARRAARCSAAPADGGKVRVRNVGFWYPSR